MRSYHYLNFDPSASMTVLVYRLGINTRYRYLLRVFIWHKIWHTLFALSPAPASLFRGDIFETKNFLPKIMKVLSMIFPIWTTCSENRNMGQWKNHRKDNLAPCVHAESHLSDKNKCIIRISIIWVQIVKWFLNIFEELFPVWR